MNSKSLNLKYLVISLILGIVLAYFVFAPTINIPFYHHDFYKYSNHISCNDDGPYHMQLGLARFGAAFLDCANSKIAYTLAGNAILRLICVLSVGIAMGLVAHWLYLSGFLFWMALFTSASIFFLPAIQTSVIMTAEFIVFAIVFAFFSNLLINKSYILLIQKDAHPRQSFILVCIGIACLFISLFTYPALSAFFLIPTLFSILFNPLKNWKQTRILVLRDVLVFILCSAVFYFLAKYVQLHHSGSELPDTYKYNMNFEILSRLPSLLKILPILWNVYYGFWQTLVVYLIICIGCVAAFTRGWPNFLSNSFLSLAQAFLAVLSTIFLSNAFFLLQPSNIYLSRIIFPFQALIVLLLVWCIHNISYIFIQYREKFILVSLGSMCLIASIYANYITTKSALNDNMELNYIASNIASYEAKGTILDRIHIIPAYSSLEHSFVGLPPREDIFNNNSTNYIGDITNIVVAALTRLRGHPVQITSCLFNEPDNSLLVEKERRCIQSAPANKIIVTYTTSNIRYYQSKNTLEIDMNHLSQLTKYSL